jgi:Ribbon-helix-helix protein, copG family
MPASKQIAVLSVRLPEPELRRIKSLAASRGVTLQEAVHQALETWASPLQPAVTLPLDALQGSLARLDVEKLMRQERKAELAKDRGRS